MSYVVAAYGVTVVVIGLYVLSVVRRSRHARRELDAARASDARGGADSQGLAE